jgi:hypothetical protein
VNPHCRCSLLASHSFSAAGWVASLLIAGCGQNAAAATCASDRDCPGQQICEKQLCVAAQNAGGDEPSGCHKDTDCKGDRICEGGKCVEPSLSNTIDGDPDAGNATSSPPSGTAGGAAPGPTSGGEARIKFCHELLIDSVQVTLTLAVAGKRFPALTHECSACDSVPANQVFAASVLHPSGESLLDFEYAFAPGEKVLFATFDNDEPVLRFGTPRGSTTCESADPFSTDGW